MRATIVLLGGEQLSPRPQVAPNHRGCPPPALASPGTIQKAKSAAAGGGVGEGGPPQQNHGAQNSAGKGPPTPPHLEPTGPEGRSLGEGESGDGGGAAGFPVAGGGRDAPPRGMRPRRHLAGRRRGGAEGLGGQVVPVGVGEGPPARVGSLPHLGQRGWSRLPPSAPQLSSATTGRLRERCRGP